MAKRADHKIKTTIGFTPRQLRALTRGAERLGISLGDYVRRLVDSMVDAIEGETKPRLGAKLYQEPRS